MAGRSFEESLEILKNLVSEIADPTMRGTGGKLRVKPSAAEKFHNMHRGNRDKRADEIAEENMTPNMVINEKMSRNSAPQHMYQDTRYRDKTVPPEIQIGHMVSDAQRRGLPQAHEMPAPLSFAEAQRMRGSTLQGPLPYEQLRQFPDDPTNPFKLKSSPFEFAWTILKGEADWYLNSIDAVQDMFGVDREKAAEMVEQIHRHQLSQAGIPQDKIDNEFNPEGRAYSDHINQNFTLPIQNALISASSGMESAGRRQRRADEKSRSIGERTSNEAFARRGLRGNPRVPQTSEEASYANISIPRESPIHGLEPFGEDGPMGASLPMPMADDVLEPIRQRQREQEPFNPFTAKPPSTPPPMRQEDDPPMGGTEAMSRGPMRSRKRGDPARKPRFKRPGFRGPNMPMTDYSAAQRG